MVEVSQVAPHTPGEEVKDKIADQVVKIFFKCEGLAKKDKGSDSDPQVELLFK